MPRQPDSRDIADAVARALAEDIGDGDRTAQLIPDSHRSSARLIVREPAVLCGRAWCEQAFLQIDPTLELNWHAEDGEAVSADDTVLEIKGATRHILTAERTAINWLQTLSGTASSVRRMSSSVAHTPCQLLDTRKTIPGLRAAQKYAVACGGGVNHRIGLFDAILIKENHIMAAGSVTAAVALARQQSPEVFVEVEVESLAELEEALAAEPDRIMLDNFDLRGLHQAVAMTAGRVKLEASGGIESEGLVAIAETGVDFISVGALTKHLRATDFSLRLSPQKHSGKPA